jgi:hypothetical protein
MIEAKDKPYGLAWNDAARHRFHFHHLDQPYPKTMLTTAQNLIASARNDPNIHENKFYMLWNVILYNHFLLDKDYDVAPQTSIIGTSTKPEYLVVKIAREEEHVVVVAELRKPLEETEAGKEKVMRSWSSISRDGMTKPTYTVSEVLASPGRPFEWTGRALINPRYLFHHPWRSNVTSSWAFDIGSTRSIQLSQIYTK